MPAEFFTLFIVAQESSPKRRKGRSARIGEERPHSIIGYTSELRVGKSRVAAAPEARP